VASWLEVCGAAKGDNEGRKRSALAWEGCISLDGLFLSLAREKVVAYV